MKGKILKILTTISFYPRILLDALLFLFVRNNYTILNKFLNNDCLIVGNGPSINKTELQNIKMPSIGMNKINLLFDKTTWRPDLIVCVNGLVIKQNKAFFNKTDIPLVLPVKAMYLGVKRRSNIIFVKISSNVKFQPNLNKSIGKGYTVTYTCLQIAAFLNVKSVNIVGVDHTFSLNNNNKQNDIELHEGNDQNHFDPNYFKGQLWGIPDLGGSEKQYFLAKSFFSKLDKEILDYTIDGKLEVFTKGEISKLYNNN